MKFHQKINKTKLNLPDSHKNPQAKKQQGFLLSTEFVVIMVAVSVIAAGIFSTMGDSDDKQRVEEAARVLVQASTNIRNRMDGFDVYTGLNNQTCYDSQIFPSDWKSTTANTFITPFSDNGLTCGTRDTATNRSGITTTGTGKYHTFTLTGIESDQCNDLVASVIDKFIQIDVGGNRIDSNATLVTNCNDENAENTIVFVNR